MWLFCVIEKLLVEIMQEKFSNDLSKSQGEKVMFYYPCWGGNICLGSSLCISKGMKKHPLCKIDLGQNREKEISPIRHSLSIGVDTRYVQHAKATRTC